MAFRVFGTTYVDVYDENGWRNVLATHDDDSAYDEMSRQIIANGTAARLRSRSGFMVAMGLLSIVTSILCVAMFAMAVVTAVGTDPDVSAVFTMAMWIVLAGLWAVMAGHTMRPVTLLSSVVGQAGAEPSGGTVSADGESVDGGDLSRFMPTIPSVTEGMPDDGGQPEPDNGQETEVIPSADAGWISYGGSVAGEAASQRNPDDGYVSSQYVSSPYVGERSGQPDDPDHGSSAPDVADGGDDAGDDEQVEQVVYPSGSASVGEDDDVTAGSDSDGRTSEQREDAEPEEEGVDGTESTEGRPRYRGRLPKRMERYRDAIGDVYRDDDGLWCVEYTFTDDIDVSDTKAEMWSAVVGRVSSMKAGGEE